MASPPTAADLAEHRLTASERALRARLQANALTVDDTEKLKRARLLRAQLADGATYQAASRVIGEHAKTLAKFANSPAYTFLCEHMDRQEIISLDETGAKAIARSRAAMAELTPEAVRYLRDCFRRAESGEPLDDAKAMWATELVARKSDLLASPHANRSKPVVVINIGQLNAACDQVRAIEAARDITPVEAVHGNVT